MTYNLGDYRYKDGKVYKRAWWFMFRCIDKGPYSFMRGVKVVNTLCGVKE